MSDKYKTCVVTAMDADFIAPTEVLLRSIDDNYKGEQQLDVYILVPKKLLSFTFVTQFENIKINLIAPVGDDNEEVSFLIHKIYNQTYKNRISGASMYRFFMADVIKNYKRAVYIDADCIIARDIDPLLEYPLATPLAAFPEVQLDYEDNPSFSGASYFNSGVMVVDLNYWRSHRVSSRLIEIANKFTDWTGASDQDILNAFFKHNWTPLPMSYNYLINIYKNIDLKNPLVIHWAGKQKPWLSNTPDNKWKQLWKKYRALGPTTA
jgi:lipopolysaccharide biosynthesis glycosyltransferase